MLFEDLLLLLAGGVGIFLIGVPGYKLYRSFVPPKRNSLQEAQQRLEQARLDAEAARLNRETEHIYNDMYRESLEEDETEDQEKHRRL